MELERSSGILVHITSLPSKYGIGDFGPDAYRFVDFLAETKQKLWQILPVSPSSSPSPYSSISTFAENPWLISPEKLIEANLLSEDDLKSIDRSELHDDYVNFKAVKQFKEILLEKAFENYQKNPKELEKKLDEFYQSEKYWIDDCVLFLTIKEKYGNVQWCDWPEEYSHRHSLTLEEFRLKNQNRLRYHLFVQYLFTQQWNQLKTYANQLNIKLIGDVPMYVDYHSADVWANSHLFLLDSKTMKSLFVSGFPSSSGYEAQIWNQPIYNWDDKDIQQEVFSRWKKRLTKTLSLVNILRIDHFRTFVSHYRIPIDTNTQKPLTSDGYWTHTPFFDELILFGKSFRGYEFFEYLRESPGNQIPIIVEDLGEVTKEVFQLRDRFQFYGIRILQMGFYTYPDNIYAPHHFIPNSMAYTGTHDNPTAIEWWRETASKKVKEEFLQYLRRPFSTEQEFTGEHISWYFIQMLLQSAANGSIVLMQDLLSVDIRMNDPGKDSSMENSNPQNWSWRFQWSQLTTEIQRELKRLTQIYGRDLIYGKSIPPKDMTMKDDLSFFQK